MLNENSMHISKITFNFCGNVKHYKFLIPLQNPTKNPIIVSKSLFGAKSQKCLITVVNNYDV